ncbi:hypothetical protein LTR62_003933 [Meristemomyces frigidus]|uniref:Uncharacterized protein n=1 Tax=Meristemomyces frigidus TaxID=1508187 RepID=A0AAN7TR88_9PEZI|nr:hypothetical protein LTR62_003933 [Meristemomyces frigidus]
MDEEELDWELSVEQRQLLRQTTSTSMTGRREAYRHYGTVASQAQVDREREIQRLPRGRKDTVGNDDIATSKRLPLPATHLPSSAEEEEEEEEAQRARDREAELDLEASLWFKELDKTIAEAEWLDQPIGERFRLTGKAVQEKICAGIGLVVEVYAPWLWWGFVLVGVALCLLVWSFACSAVPC